MKTDEEDVTGREIQENNVFYHSQNSPVPGQRGSKPGSGPTSGQSLRGQRQNPKTTGV